MAETVEHIVHEATEAPAEAISDAAAVAVATAHNAANLAATTAAHAELQAAEEVAEVKEEAEEWRVILSGQMARMDELGQTLVTTSENVASLHSREEERAARETALHQRIEALEAHLSSTPHQSGTPAEETVAERTEQAPIVGVESEATAGPASLGGEVSSHRLEAEAEIRNPLASGSRARRRWI